jgi:hypothetical protein
VNIEHYITGERLQELADHTIVSLNPQILKQLDNTNCKYTNIDFNQPICISEGIRNAKILFVYTHLLDLFLQHVFPLLENPFVLVTHNSDHGILERHRQYLDNDKIIKWFAQNADIVHQKLVPLPIGIANSQWSHGNLALFDKIRNENNQKTNLVYKNFDVNTSHCNRYHVEVATARNGILMSPRKSIEEFLRDLSRSVFSICPMGSGTDNHRIWESLYLGTIPVVADCPHNSGFKELPMIRLSDGQFRNWEYVTKDFLNDAYDKMKNNKYDMSKLDLNYWKEQIR